MVCSLSFPARTLYKLPRTLHNILHTRRLTMSASKRPCTVKSIGTHNGTFHCDEALACYMLQKLPEYSDAEIMRSRDDAVLESCDIVVDVGGVYDPSKHRYDHHQRSFSGTMKSLTDGKKKWITKLSSAGLVYLHFGHRVLSNISEIPSDSPVLEDLYDFVYSEFMEEIDAMDNGISDRDGEPRYSINSTIGKRVARLNPEWYETSSEEDAMKRFKKAMQLVGGELLETVKYFKTSWIPAKEIVKKAIETRHQVHQSGEVIKLDPFCPWKNHLFLLEQSLSISPSIKYTLFTDQSNKWRIQAVPLNPNTFENRLSLPEAWRGLRGAELDDVAGIQGCVFVHSNGFIGGHGTFEGALKMATTSLELQANT